MTIIQSPLYSRLRASKARAHLDGLEKAHVSVRSQAKVTKTERRPHLPEPSGSPPKKRPRIKEEAQKKTPTQAPRTLALTQAQYAHELGPPTVLTSTGIHSYQMGEPQDVWKEPAMALQSTTVFGGALSGRTTTSQHNVWLQDQVHDVSTHPVRRKRNEECREKTPFRMALISSPFRRMASAIHQRTLASNLDSLIVWAQSILPATPAAAYSTEKAKANWAATAKSERRALALFFFGAKPLAQPTAGQPTGTNSRGQPVPPPSGELSLGRINSLLSDLVTLITTPVADIEGEGHRP